MATQRMTMNGKTMYRDGLDEKPRKDNPSQKKKGADDKVCWEGYRYQGTVNGKDKCVKVNRK
jgi:hypothetical protein